MRRAEGSRPPRRRGALRLAILLAAGSSLAHATPRPAWSGAGDERDKTLEVASPDVLERAVVIGASGSAGFFLSMEMAAVFGAMIDFAHDPASLEPSPRAPASRSDARFFLHPLQEGEAQVEFALQQEPTLVVAWDFLFWFAYGALDVRGESMEQEERIELLDHGLALLDRIPCRILVADLPDMSAAIGRMLMASQVPVPRIRAALNERIHAWAAERPRVRILPLERTHADLVDGGGVRIGTYCWPEGPAERLLQWDRLHPTLEGMIGVVHLIGVELVESGWVPAEALMLDLHALMERFRITSLVRRCESAQGAPR